MQEKAKGIIAAILAGCILFFLFVSYLLSTPLTALIGLSSGNAEWIKLITGFKKDTQEISRYYGFYDWENMNIIPGETEVVYYSQKDPAWASHYYDTRSNKRQTIRSGGCGPTSLAIVYTSLTHEIMTPDDMASYAMENGYCAAPNGSYRSLFTSGAAKLGLTNYYIGKDLQQALEAMTEGRLMVALMGKGIFCDGGHFVVIRGVTEDGKLLMADCWNEKNNDKEWDMDIIAENLKIDSANCLWVLGYEEGDDHE